MGSRSGFCLVLFSSPQKKLCSGKSIAFFVSFISLGKILVLARSSVLFLGFDELWRDLFSIHIIL